MRGSEAGCFTWPRGLAVGPDNTIVVADSSNHRVQVTKNCNILIIEISIFQGLKKKFKLPFIFKDNLKMINSIAS